tara:strand:+ start:136 stop:360 length:225 start_codon:yes stop_codon:yes gene_type:complete
MLSRYIVKITKIIEIKNSINHSIDTEAVIPIVMLAKYTTSSKGDLTGFRNLTIERAPTIPKDRAIFPEITEVIT